MVKSAEQGRRNSTKPIRSEKDIQDLLWALNRRPGRGGRKEGIETHPLYPLEDFRWYDRLDFYRLAIAQNLARLIPIDEFCSRAEHLKNNIISWGLWSIDYDWAQLHNTEVEETSNPWYLLRERFREDESREMIDLLYLRCCQTRDATDPWFVGRQDTRKQEIHYHAKTLALLLGQIGSDLGPFPFNRNEFWELSNQFLKNYPAHDSYRRRRVKGAYQDLDRIMHMTEQLGKE